MWLDLPFRDKFSNRISTKDLHKLKNFYMAQQALSRELQAAKPLGICKTTTSTSTKVIGIHTDPSEAKEMFHQLINTKKHIVQLSQSQVSQGTVLNTIVASAIEGAPTTPTHVAEGATVKAVYVEIWAQNGSSSTVGSVTAAFYKNPGGANYANTADMAALHDWDNKKNIFHCCQGLLPTTDSGLFLVYKGWIKIPKGKQRMGLGDLLVLTVRNNNASAIDQEFCGLFVYKERR